MGKLKLSKSEVLSGNEVNDKILISPKTVACAPGLGKLGEASLTGIASGLEAECKKDVMKLFPNTLSKFFIISNG